MSKSKIATMIMTLLIALMVVGGLYALFVYVVVKLIKAAWN